MTKKIMVAASLLVLTSSTSAFAFPLFHKNSDKQAAATATTIATTTTADGKLKVDLPPRQSRRRMLVDCGLFGMGVHVGWLKPKNANTTELTGGTASGGHGNPIFNVSAGQKVFGIGTNAYK